MGREKLGKKVLEAFNKNPEALVFANGRTLTNPYAAFVSPNRGILDVAAENQAIGVVNPEPARIESLFTPGLLRSSFNHEVTENRKVLKRIDKVVNGVKTSKSFFILQNEDGSIGAYEYNKYISLNEGFGFINVGELGQLNEGDTLKPTEHLQKSINYTSSGVSRGKNYRTAYSITDETIEDSIEISDRVKKDFRFYMIYEMSIVIDPAVAILKDLYGEGDSYKPFPGVGETVNKRDTFAAISHYNTAYQFIKPLNSLRNIALNDTTYHIEDGSVVTDIEILTARDENVKDLYLKSLHQDNLKYFMECYDTLNVYYAQGFTLDKDAYYYWDRLRGMTRQYNKTVGYRIDRYVIPEGHIMINASFYKECELEPGMKMSGRHGNKGVENDVEKGLRIKGVFKYGTIVDEYGEPVDIWCNTLGVINRSNPAQLFEKIDNRAYDKTLEYFRRQLKETGEVDLVKFGDILSTITKLIAPEQYQLTVEASPEEKLSLRDPDVLMDILHNDLIIYPNPWPQECWSEEYTVNSLIRHFEVFKYLESEGISLSKDKVYRVNLETGERIEAGFNVEISRMYFKLLEYTAKKKFVMRMVGAYDNKGGLTKTKDKKEHKSRFGDTPVKVGERDIAVIASQLGIHVEVLHQFLSQTDSDVVETISAFFKVFGVRLKIDDAIESRLENYYKNILNSK